MATFQNTGIASVAGLINGEVTNFFDYIALGEGTDAEVATQTELVTEIATNGGSRATSTNSQVTTTVTNDTAQFLKTFSFTGTLTINECGVFDAASTGVMLMRHKFASTKNVEDGDSLQLTIKMQVT